MKTLNKILPKPPVSRFVGISVASDRARTRWGRRIPFLLGATPFVTLTLVLIGLVGLLLVVPMQLVFLFFDIPPDQARVIYMVLFVLHISVQAFYHAAQTPLSMRLFPKERFGQFNTAGAIIAGPIMMLAGLLVGVWRVARRLVSGWKRRQVG